MAEGLREQSVEACLDAAVDFAMKNRRAVLHICNSGSRETYERELSRICDYASLSYMEQRFRGTPIDPGISRRSCSCSNACSMVSSWTG